jgi:hypothetical protein
MFDGTEPPKTTGQAVSDSLKPAIENVACIDNSIDSAGYRTRKDTIVWNAAIELMGSGSGYSPAFSGTLGYGRLKLTEFTDFGYVGDPKRENNLGREFSETHAYFNMGFPVKPAAQFDLTYDWNSGKTDSKILRVGLAKDIRIGGDANILLECYPLSTKTDSRGKMQNEAILSSRFKISDDVSFYGMGRFFNTGKEFTPLGKIGVMWNINDKWSFKGEYRNWPKLNKGKKSRDSSIYIGFARRFTDKR